MVGSLFLFLDPAGRPTFLFGAGSMVSRPPVEVRFLGLPGEFEEEDEEEDEDDAAAGNKSGNTSRTSMSVVWVSTERRGKKVS